ncbi:hypothetical protein HSX11_29420 [Oxalobacteraceae bacterium]|nr:hypothetical protein [Oxalobacteraceae bacterium]
MGIEMTFEIDGQLSSKRVLEILKANGFVEYEQLDSGFCAFHAESRLDAYFYMKEEPEAVLAEGLIPPKWKCTFRMTFRFSKDNYQASEFETMKFSRALASQSPAYFALSFQYENVFAIRDERGYREISDTTATMQTPV